MKDDPLVTGVKVKLDKERTLRLDLNAMVRFEQASGKSLLKQSTWDTLSIADIRSLLWACLLHEDPELTVEQVGSMIHPGNMVQVFGEIQRVWQLSAPEPTGEASDRPLQ